MSDTVLVTGASGFVAQHCILQLLEAGYDVRGTLRHADRESEVRRVLDEHLSSAARSRLPDSFSVAVADLTADEGWPAAATGCRFVLHVASPLPLAQPKDEDEVIVPAREGTLRVLRAADEAGVARLVLTSSIAAMMYGPGRARVLDDDDWSDLDNRSIDAYARSKTIAERAAWAYAQSRGTDTQMDVVAINPGIVLGPLLSADASVSVETVSRLMNHQVPGIPNLTFPIVDVRDVAAAHLSAMTTPEASGQRYLCARSSVPLREIAFILSRHFSEQGFKVPTRRLPKPALRFAALFDKDLRFVVREVGLPLRINTTKIRRQLGFTPRDVTTTAIDTAESMVRYGIVSTTRPRRRRGAVNPPAG